MDAHSARPVRNRLLAASLADLLEERKLVSTPEELKKLAEKYDIDLVKLENIARHVNSPSIDEASVVKRIDDDGSEQMKMTVGRFLQCLSLSLTPNVMYQAAWVVPDIQDDASSLMPPRH